MLTGEKRGGFTLEQNKKSAKITHLSDLAFERDKEKAGAELRDYFVKKNRQIKAAQLINAITSSLRKQVFSSSEANKLTDFLSRKFDIRGPAIQYAQAGYLSACPKPDIGSAKSIKKTFFKKPKKQGSDLFHHLFLRLQAAVQDNLLEYNGARVLVRDIVTSYPASRDSLRR
jgi:hypothetical protein